MKKMLRDVDAGQKVKLHCGCDAQLFDDLEYGNLMESQMQVQKLPDHVRAWTWVRIHRKQCDDESHRRMYHPFDPDTEVTVLADV